MTDEPRGEIIIYKTDSGRTSLDVRLENETVWLTQQQIGELFSTERSVVTKHIQNILKAEELDRDSVCAKFAHTAADGKTYQTQYYNLDMILSVGYRVNSKRGTEFRIWATNTLRDHITKGYTINQRRLAERNERYQELQEAVALIGEVLHQRELDGSQADGLLRVITNYAYALSVLDDYDHQRLVVRNTTANEVFHITYEAAREAIDRMTDRMRSGGVNVGLFGREKDDSFRGSLAAIYQTFGGEELYPSIEEKAAHLLYFIVKNHSFTDGNKRIAAVVFLWFLDENGVLYAGNGRKRIGDNALVALTLMIAESKPQHKDTVVKVVVNLINSDN
ncbi:MAG: virulence protein RhuM/Fic/DOC family protein [Armatimonadetes bacterium]|nr:virulence protein RhuM/Fic/DOC family protein [Armatimonadota bacterium]